MKRLSLAVAVLAMVAVASCGGSSGGSTPTTTQGMINSSVVAFGNLVDAAYALAEGGGCTAKAVWDCGGACDNAGGVLDLDDATDSATLQNCEKSGLGFTGTVVSQNDTDTQVSLNAAGYCDNFSGTVTDTGGDTSNCSGTMSFTCNGATGTCNMSTDCNSCTIATTDGGDTTDGGGGGTDGGTNAVKNLENSVDSFMGNVFMVPQDPNAVCDGVAPTYTNCPCAGGGTFDMDLGTYQFEYYSCYETAAYTYTGTITYSETSTTATVNVDMAPFGTCTDVSGSFTIDTVNSTETTPVCTAGTLQATCPDGTGGSETFTCNVQTDCTCA